jgi:tetraacyldisaccharide 4'-kinase
VISIGSLTVGGAGKTPFTNYLAEELKRRGRQPAILTRGYRRRTPARNIILPPSAEVSPSLTGDEAQIFLRAGTCPIGIGADRAETGKLLLQHYPVDLVLLDDGFQHRKLHRDIDIVIVDGLMPLGHEHTLPLGQLREPLKGIARADAIVITRAENDLRFQLLAKRFRGFNAQAPIFRVFTLPRRWRMCQQRVTVEELPSRRVAAFCGLGNPQGFWNTLAEMGFHVVFRWTFPDHHVYQPAELRRLAQQAKDEGADLLVTTEKDRINFPVDFASIVAPFEIAWLEIENALERENEFFDWLETRLAAASAAGVEAPPVSYRHSRFVGHTRLRRTLPAPRLTLRLPIHVGHNRLLRHALDNHMIGIREISQLLTHRGAFARIGHFCQAAIQNHLVFLGIVFEMIACAGARAPRGRLHDFYFSIGEGVVK